MSAVTGLRFPLAVSPAFAVLARKAVVPVTGVSERSCRFYSFNAFRLSEPAAVSFWDPADSRHSLRASFRAFNLGRSFARSQGISPLTDQVRSCPFRPPGVLPFVGATGPLGLLTLSRFTLLASSRILTGFRPRASLASEVGVFLSPEHRPLQDSRPCTPCIAWVGSPALAYGAFALSPRTSRYAFTSPLGPLRALCPASPGFPGRARSHSATRASLIFV